MTLAEELIDPREPEIVDRLVAQNLKTAWRDSNGTPMRGQHAKHHGCVEGVFAIHNNIPCELTHGVFQPGRRYDCLVRFSNGAQQDDRKKDVRGIAIKLLGIDGLKLLPGWGHAREQDFILVDHPTYFTATMDDYMAFNRHFTPVQDLRANGFSPMRALWALVGLAVLLVAYRKVLRAASAFAGRKAGSPLSLTYHSTTPYLLGTGLAVKYKAVGTSSDTPDATSKNGIGQALWNALSEAPATFDFGVVIQSDPEIHPIENPSVDWEINSARYVSIAELTIMQQESTEKKMNLAKSLVFNPWMSISAHRPLGAINRARRLIYAAMSRLRSARSSAALDSKLKG